MKYILQAIFAIIVAIVAMVVAPVLPLFARPLIGPCDNNHANRIEPRLPSWLSWFQTPDNSLYGDIGWRTIHCPDWSSYLGQVKWLWRNPAYGFDWNGPCSAHFAFDSMLEWAGDPFIRDGKNPIVGTCNTVVANQDGTTFWNYSKVARYGDWLLKLNFGWKVKTLAENPQRLLTQTRAPIVFAIRLSRIKNA